MEYSCNLRAEYWDAVVSGAKTAEGRVCAGKFAEIRAGDRICFWREDGCAGCRKTVREVRRFGSFAEMVAGVGRGALVPGAESDAAAVAAYEAIPGYAERAGRDGVVALLLE